MAASKPAGLYAGAMLFLHDEADDAVTIFLNDWDDLTRQVFYFDDAHYINGLDPTFMQLYNEKLFDEWVSITRGRINSPGEVIRERFKADYVVSDLKHEAFLEKAYAEASLNEIYRDEYAVIFALK